MSALDCPKSSPTFRERSSKRRAYSRPASLRLKPGSSSGSMCPTAAALTGCDRMLLPTAAERLVERHLIGELRLAYRNQFLLSGVKRALGVEGGQVVVDPG